MQQPPDSGVRYIHPLSMCAPRFNLLGLTVPEKSVTKIFNVWILEKEKIKNKGTNKQQQPDSGIHDTFTQSTCVPSFNLLGLTAPDKSVTKNFNVWKLERKKMKK